MCVTWPWSTFTNICVTTSRAFNVRRFPCQLHPREPTCRAGAFSLMGSHSVLFALLPLPLGSKS